MDRKMEEQVLGVDWKVGASFGSLSESGDQALKAGT